MYYAYSISLMYFLRAKNDPYMIDHIFNKLSLNPTQKCQLIFLLSKNPLQEFTTYEIEEIIEPILGEATRSLTARETELEFKSFPLETLLFASTNSGLSFYFKHLVAKKKPELASLIERELIDPDSSDAAIYRVAGLKKAMMKFISGRLSHIIEEFQSHWETKERKCEDLTVSEKRAHKVILLDEILSTQTVEFFSANNFEFFYGYINHLRHDLWGSAESLFILHRAIQDALPLFDSQEIMGTGYEIVLHIHRDGSIPWEQPGSPVMILNNIGNLHWTSKIPETIFSRPLVSEEPRIRKQLKEQLKAYSPHREEYLFPKEQSGSQKIQEYVVLGAGIAGTLLALELSQYLDKKNKELLGKEKPYKITILEKRGSALAGSSDRTPCRLGLGFHYADYETAAKYYKATISLLKKYRARGIDLRLNIDPAYAPLDKSGKKEQDPLHRGRYFFVEDTVMPFGKVFTVYDRLKKLYKEDCDMLDEHGESPNKLLGEPDDFYKLLTLSEIEKIDSNIVDKDRVTAVVETAECILNWPLLKKTILEDIESDSRITLQTRADIQTIAPKGNPLDGYSITYRDEEGREKIISADVVVNATWENISYFNQQLSIPPQEITNRLKIMIAVDLPESLQKEHCMFFCFGPHASFTNNGNGTGFITAEKYTNHLQSTGLKITAEMEKILYGLADTATAEEKDELKKIKEDVARKILEETTKYIPAMKDAKIRMNASGELAIYSGIVRTEGVVRELDSPTSSIHQRNTSGVRGHKIAGLPNYFEDASYKLMYALNNAYEVVALMKTALEELDLLKLAINELTYWDDATTPRVSFSGEMARNSTQVLDSFFGSKLCRSAPSEGARKELIKAVAAPVVFAAFFSGSEKYTPVDKIKDTLEQTLEAKESLLETFKQSRFFYKKREESEFVPTVIISP